MKTLTILAGVMLVFVFVWERVDVVRVGYQIERLNHPAGECWNGSFPDRCAGKVARW